MGSRFNFSRALGCGGDGILGLGVCAPGKLKSLSHVHQEDQMKDLNLSPNWS